MSIEMTINGIVYVPKDEQVNRDAFFVTDEEKVFCIVRCDRSGVFAGYVLKSDLLKKGKAIFDSIRLWQWYGATLSQLSQEGTPDQAKCKFAVTEAIKYVHDAIETTPCTENARKNLQAVEQWKI